MTRVNFSTGADETIGPWKRRDIASFVALCNDACSLAEPESGISDGLLTPPRRAPRPFRDLNGAWQALQQHPIYRYLRLSAPEVLGAFEAGREPTEAKFKFLRITVRFMAGCWDTKGIAGSDATRARDEAAVRAIERLERHMECVLGHLSNAPKRQMLIQLLEEAKRELLFPRLSGRRHSRTILRALADELMREVTFVSPQFLLAVASVTGISLGKRDAQRYCKEARTAAQ